MSRWRLDVVALTVVGGDDADALQALGEIGQDQCDAVAHLVVAALGARLNQIDMMTSGGRTEKTVMAASVALVAKRKMVMTTMVRP